jgi:hypothetical protein
VSWLAVPCSASPDAVSPARPAAGPDQGFGIRFGKKNSVPTEMDEFRENSDEFKTQFGEFSECEA